jgi:hypothetical protein
VEAKLMRFSDLAREEPGFGWGLNGSEANIYVWAVAVAGQPAGSNGGSGSSWNISLVKDEPGTPHEWGGIGGPREPVARIVSWPPFWDSLPDYSRGQ